jgi:hypothetical protein
MVFPFRAFRSTRHNILVAGSFRGKSNPKREEHTEVCRTIGRRLGRRPDVNLLVCGLHPNCSDYFVVEGALSVRDEKSISEDCATITLYKTDSDETEKIDDPLFAKFKALGSKNGCLLRNHPSDKSKWDGAFLSASKDADALLVLGGGPRTQELMDFANSRDACILGVKLGYGIGDQKFTDSFQVFRYFGLSEAELLEFERSKIVSSTDDGFFHSIVKAAERNPWAGRGVRKNHLLAFSMLAAVVAVWAVLFLLPGTAFQTAIAKTTTVAVDSSVISGIRLFALCTLSAGIGSLVGSLVRIKLSPVAWRRAFLASFAQASIFGTVGFSAILIFSYVVMSDLVGAGIVTTANFFEVIGEPTLTFLFGSLLSALLGYGGLALVLSLVRKYRPQIT